MIAVPGGQIDKDKAARFIGQLVENSLHRFFAAKSAIQPCEIFEVRTQSVCIDIGQIHQLGL